MAEPQVQPQPKAVVKAAPAKEIVKLDKEYFAKNFRLGTEEVDSTDLIAPVLKLIQKTSKDLADDGRPFAEGTFLYSGAKASQPVVDVTFLSFTKKDAPMFTDRTQTERVYVFFGVMHPNLLPFRMFFRSTNIGAAKKFLTEWTRTKMPMFTQKIQITSQKIDGELGTYYKAVLKIDGTIEDSATILKLEELARTYGPVIKDHALDAETVEPSDIPF